MQQALRGRDVRDYHVIHSFQFGDMVHGLVLDHLRSPMILEHL